MNRQQFKPQLTLSIAYNEHIYNDALMLIRQDKKRSTGAEKQNLQKVDNMIQLMLENLDNVLVDSKSLKNILLGYFIDEMSMTDIYNYVFEQKNKQTSNDKAVIFRSALLSLLNENSSILAWNDQIHSIENEIREIEYSMVEIFGIDYTRVKIENAKKSDRLLSMIQKRDIINNNIAYIKAHIGAFKERNKKLREFIDCMEIQDAATIKQYLSTKREFNKYKDNSYDDFKLEKQVEDVIHKYVDIITEF